MPGLSADQHQVTWKTAWGGTELTPPRSHQEIDFAGVKPGKYSYKYILAFIDTFSGWVETIPTKHETVVKKLLQDIIPRFGTPALQGSDNGPVFAAQVTQNIAKVLGAGWKLYCVYRP